MIILATNLILMCVIVSGATDGTEMKCFSTVRVPRNIVYLAPVMTQLKINCAVTLHGCHRSPIVSWCKIYGNGCIFLNYSDHIRTELKNITDNEWMVFLVFLNISLEDTGLYRCKESNMSMGHGINVTVTADNKKEEFSLTSNNTIPTTVHDVNTPPNDGQQWLWYFVYICSGTAGLVFIVIIVSFIYIFSQGRKSTKKDMASKNQNMENYLLLHPDLNSDVLTSVVYRA